MSRWRAPVGPSWSPGWTSESGAHCQSVDGSSDSICNGADDNASGVAVLLELAKALSSRALRPERSVAFAFFGGEELGLLGSREMLAGSSLASFTTVAMVNLDMVGRLEGGRLSVSGLGSSDDWLGVLRAVDAGSFPAEFDRIVTTRSDHAEFYRAGVPVLFFSTGLHADYHKPSDEFEQIDVSGMATVAALVLRVVLRLASGPPIHFTEQDPAKLPILSPNLPGSDPGTRVDIEEEK